VVYKVLIDRKVKKALKKLPNVDYLSVKMAILDLAKNPRPFGYEKLKKRDGYRIRQGNYRILYDIEDDIKIVKVLDVGHRKDIYL